MNKHNIYSQADAMIEINKLGATYLELWNYVKCSDTQKSLKALSKYREGIVPISDWHNENKCCNVHPTNNQKKWKIVWEIFSRPLAYIEEIEGGALFKFTVRQPGLGNERYTIYSIFLPH